MDFPPAPQDSGLRNIIDKLAEFVARNGQEFESITKVKQQGNPRFSFLFGGDYHQYYQWRVQAEQSMLKQHVMGQPPGFQQQPQQQQQQTHVPPPHMQMANNNMMPMNNSWGPTSQPPPINPNVTAQIESIAKQRNTLLEQIRQSEMNLAAQKELMQRKQDSQMDDIIATIQTDAIAAQADEKNIRLPEFDSVLQPIMDSCTKDSISAGKNFILQHSNDIGKCNVLLEYLLKRALTNGVTFLPKLHLIYLVNDILHHCVRKQVDELKNSLENIVIPMFCSAQIIANEEQKAKLMKLLSLWQSKSNFFDACVISKLQSPNSSMQEYKTNMMNKHATPIANALKGSQASFDNYQQQHLTFVQHVNQQITLLENQKQTLEQQLQAPKIPPLMPLGPDDLMNPSNVQLNGNQAGNNFGPNDRNKKLAPLMSQNISLPNLRAFDGGDNNYGGPPNADMHSNLYNNMGDGGMLAGGQPVGMNNFQVPPPNFLIPDLSRPPPGFNSGQPPPMQATAQQPVASQQQPPQQHSIPPLIPELTNQPPPIEDSKPSAPYYELPAALMVPLIRLEDCSYKPLDAEDIRLPAPAPPSERLIAAIEAFYAPPSHERIREADGWERLALYEYYKVKNAARKVKEEEINDGAREKSRSPSPIVIEVGKTAAPNKRRYRSMSRSPARVPSRSRSRSRSPSKSPEIRGRSRNRRSKSRSRSPSRRGRRNFNRNARRSQSPPNTKRDNSFHRGRDREQRDRGNDRDAQDLERPSFFGGNYAKSQTECIEESNKGHQMLMKMGWAGSGTGLGSKGQGIDAPISGGEVRDRQDQYKGVGINLNDPYENFRKNKGAAFINRMRIRDTERKKTKPGGNSAEEAETDY